MNEGEGHQQEKANGRVIPTSPSSPSPSYKDRHESLSEPEDERDGDDIELELYNLENMEIMNDGNVGGSSNKTLSALVMRVMQVWDAARGRIARRWPFDRGRMTSSGRGKGYQMLPMHTNKKLPSLPLGVEDPRRRRGEAWATGASRIGFILLFSLISFNLIFGLYVLYLPIPDMGYHIYLNHSRLAVMIERRDQPHLIPVLLSFLNRVNGEWPFLIYSGKENHETLTTSRFLKPFIDTGKLTINFLPEEEKIKDGVSLSNYLTTPLFWEMLPQEAENLLFFQSDSVLCSHSKESINDFLGFEVYPGGYDWVGAPWDWRGFPATPWGGNGGFSLRRKSTMINITRRANWTYAGTHNSAEDTFFAEEIAKTTNRFPTTERALQWAYENPLQEEKALDYVFEPLGVHTGRGAWRACVTHDVYSTEKILGWCPELRMILPKECIL